MIGWHHQLNAQKFGQVQGDGERQGSLACCSPWVFQSVRHEWVTEKQPHCKVLMVIYLFVHLTFKLLDFLSIYKFLYKYLFSFILLKNRSGMDGFYAKCLYKLWRNCKTFYKLVIPIYHTFITDSEF